MTTTEFKTISFTTADKIGTLTINRPDSLNALNKQVISELKSLLQQLEGKRDIRALIVTGSGEKAFVAGADIKEMDGMSHALAREMAIQGQSVMQKLADLHMPVVAAVNGFALGGGLELALACDFIVASNKAKWGLPEVTLGLIPGYGGTQRLMRAIGISNAKRVALSGEIFTAQQGLEWGLFTQLTEPSELISVATKIAQTLSTRAPMALTWVKEAMAKGSDHALADGLKIECELFARTFETQDQKEGVHAFIEKRPPQFTGS